MVFLELIRRKGKLILKKCVLRVVRPVLLLLQLSAASNLSVHELLILIFKHRDLFDFKINCVFIHYVCIQLCP